MPLKLANNAVSRLSASLSAASTTLGVMPGDGAKFPALSAGDWCPLTIIKADGTLEIVRATARSSDTFTVVRAQEGTTATDFSAGDRVELRMTKGAVNDIEQRVDKSVLSYPDYAAASAAAATLQDGQLVVDSSTKLEYIVQSGALSKVAPFLPSEGVARVADLLQVSPDRVATAVHVRGYHLGGLGGGNYVWDAAKAKSAHDGGVVISPTVPWDGSLGTLSAFLSGTGETSPSGTGCWVRVSDGKETVACWGAVGNDAQDDTTSVIKAKAWFDSKNRPTIFPKGFKCLLTQRLSFTTSYTGIVFDGDDFSPYSYQNWAAIPQGLRFDVSGGLGTDSALAFDCLAPCCKNFGVSGLMGDGFAFDICTYSGLYQNIRVVGFNGSVAKHGQGVNVSEPIFNTFINFDAYSLRYGLLLGRNSALVEREGAFNENTYINCRFRGDVHSLWATKSVDPIAYGTLLINCIFQETAPIGSESDYFDIIRFEGGKVRGFQFIGGRIECKATAGRKTPRMDLSGVEAAKPLLYFNGTYIHTSIQWNDPNDVRGGIGDVYSAEARLYGLRSKFVRTPVLSPRASGETLVIQQIPGDATQCTTSFDVATSESGHVVTAPYATSASPQPNTVAYHRYRFRQGNVWRTAQVSGKALLGSPGLAFTVEGSDVLFLRSGGLIPLTDNTFSLGTTSYGFTAGYFANGLYVGGKKVISAQQTAIANAVAGTEVATINSILAAMRVHGLIAT